MMDANRESAGANRAVLLWDGDCGFCARWIKRWRRWTRGAVSDRPYQQALGDFPQVSEEDCARSVHLVLPDGAVYFGAHAIFKSLALAGRLPALERCYRKSRAFRRLAEWLYRMVARHRGHLPNV